MEEEKGDLCFPPLDVLQNLSCSSRADWGLLFKIVPQRHPHRATRNSIYLKCSRTESPLVTFSWFADNLCFEIKKKKKKPNTRRFLSSSSSPSPLLLLLILLTPILNHGLPRWLKWSRIYLPMQEMQETQVWSLVWENPLEKEMQPSSIFLPGKSHGKRSLEGYSPQGRKKVRYNWAHTLSTFLIINKTVNWTLTV